MKLSVVLSCYVVLLSAIVYSTQDVHAHFVEPAEDDKCPVCGMPPGTHPNWVAVIMFQDGNHEKFHGPKNMFIYYFNIEKYSNEYKRENIAGLYVTDYYTHKHIKAPKALYVIESDVTGPMGADLIPLKDSNSAEAFTNEHGGSIVSFSEITPEIISNLWNIMPDDSL